MVVVALLACHVNGGRSLKWLKKIIGVWGQQKPAMPAVLSLSFSPGADQDSTVAMIVRLVGEQDRGEAGVCRAGDSELGDYCVPFLVVVSGTRLSRMAHHAAALASADRVVPRAASSGTWVILSAEGDLWHPSLHRALASSVRRHSRQADALLLKGVMEAVAGDASAGGAPAAVPRMRFRLVAENTVSALCLRSELLAEYFGSVASSELTHASLSENALVTWLTTARSDRVVEAAHFGGRWLRFHSRADEAAHPLDDSHWLSARAARVRDRIAEARPHTRAKLASLFLRVRHRGMLPGKYTLEELADAESADPGLAREARVLLGSMHAIELMYPWRMPAPALAPALCEAAGM